MIKNVIFFSLFSIIMTSCSTVDCDCDEIVKSKGKFYKSGIYKDDNRVSFGEIFSGVCESKFADGSLKKRQEYSNGIKHGKHIEYHTSEQVKFETEYKEGKRVTHKSYFKNGQMHHDIKRYEDGNEFEYVKYFENGKKFEERNDNYFARYQENGDFYYEAEYFDDYVLYTSYTDFQIYKNATHPMQQMRFSRYQGRKKNGEDSHTELLLLEFGGFINGKNYATLNIWSQNISENEYNNFFKKLTSKIKTPIEITLDYNDSFNENIKKLSKLSKSFSNLTIVNHTDEKYIESRIQSELLNKTLSYPDIYSDYNGSGIKFSNVSINITQLESNKVSGTVIRNDKKYNFQGEYILDGYFITLMMNEVSDNNEVIGQYKTEIIFYLERNKTLSLNRFYTEWKSNSPIDSGQGKPEHATISLGHDGQITNIK